MSNCTAPHKRCSALYCHRDTTTILIAYRHGFWKVGVACRGLVEAYPTDLFRARGDSVIILLRNGGSLDQDGDHGPCENRQIIEQLDSDLRKALRDAVRQVIQM
jgi:predicted CxxxxCH...CXXCH cytochrome family protein